MKARTRRRLEMGARALIFCRLYPTPSTGYARLLAKLEVCLVRATAMAEEKRQGTLESHVAALGKLELLRTVRTVHLAHLRHVAQIAAVDLPDLALKFKLKRGTISYREFQVAARALAEEALRRKDELVQQRRRPLKLPPHRSSPHYPIASRSGPSPHLLAKRGGAHLADDRAAMKIGLALARG